MPQRGYQEGSEILWWWKVAQHLDEAQRSLVNAMVHNLDDQTVVFALQDKLREGQALLLGIFGMKGLLPAAVNGKVEVPGAHFPGVGATQGEAPVAFSPVGEAVQVEIPVAFPPGVEATQAGVIGVPTIVVAQPVDVDKP